MLQEIWTLSYIETKQLTDNSIKINQAKDFVLELYGNQPLLNDTALVKKALSQWCKAKARHIFNLMLQQLAERHGFHYQRLSIRAQKTRWGSCSHQKNINLNCKLLLMPLDVVKYVMIHELCHTIEMNHSSRFWKLVEDCDPNYKINRNKLKTLGRKVVI